MSNNDIHSVSIDKSLRKSPIYIIRQQDYVVDGDVGTDIGDVGELDCLPLVRLVGVDERFWSLRGVLERLLPRRLSIENGLSLLLSSLPLTDKSILPLCISSSFLSKGLRTILLGLSVDLRATLATSSLRRSRRLKPQRLIPCWWFKSKFILSPLFGLWCSPEECDILPWSLWSMVSLE